MEPQVLIVPRFLEPEACRRIRRAMDEGIAETSEILQDGIQADVGVRRSACIEVDAATLAFVEQQLDSSREQIETHFGVALARREGASCVRYETGGFFRRHVDRGEVQSWPGAAQRRISTIVFLSTSRDASRDGTFDGGSLRLFGSAPERILDLRPESGMLVAFPAETPHEVLEVRAGTRDVIVDWFY